VLQKYGNLKHWSGIYLLILSVIMYCGLLLVPLVSYSVETKMVLTFSLVLLGEACFIIGCLIVGKTVVSKYKDDIVRSIRRWLTKGGDEMLPK